MKNYLIELIENKCKGAKPLYLVIRGSHAYGTNIETSDIDYTGVFIQSEEDILGNKYIEQINDDKNDIVIYEIRRFLELIEKNNPTVLEILATPDDCIIYKDPCFDEILSHKDKFITKLCANSFGGYAKAQILKAKGQNKKQNWKLDKVSRKTPIDFCYFINNEKSINLLEYLTSNNMDQKFCGLSKITHAKDIYALFYDKISESLYSDKINKYKKILNKIINKILCKKIFKFKGISFEFSNDIRLSSIPLNCSSKYFIGIISYNKDGYMQHCKDYKSYQTWLSERNENRWVDVKSHNQKIDGKNMMHCRRLMDMAKEIAEGKGIIVKRPNACELIDIRKGKTDLQSLINHIENEIIEVNNLFENCNLPNDVDKDLIHNLIIKTRKQIYK